MAANRMLGIEIGNYSVKMAVCQNRTLKQFVSEKIPDNMVKDNKIVSWDAMADFLKEVIRTKGVKCRQCAIALPADTSFIRRVTMPLMTEQQLKVNLPYEFHNYISQDMEKYIYDYAVISRTEKEMDLLAVAAGRDFIDKYVEMCRRAGLKLVLIAPDIIAFRNILRSYEQEHGLEHGAADYAILDVGDRKIDLHFFSHGEYEVTRSLETGCHELMKTISELTGQEVHIAKFAQEQSVDSSVMKDEKVQDSISSISVQLMRVLNFYSYNNPENTIDKLYICGGGSRITELMQDISHTTGLEQRPLTDLISGDGGLKALLDTSPQAMGIVMQEL